jgi:elongation factor P
MKSADKLRAGSTFEDNGVPFLILKAERFQSTSGKRQRAPEITFKVKDLISGRVNETTVKASDMMNDIMLDKDSMQFLYQDGEDYNFMNQETFDQIALTVDDLGDAVNYLKEEIVIDILFYEGKPVGVELPNHMVFKVTYTEPGLKGDTTGKALKPATIETGYELMVPLFINMDELIRIDTRTGKYVERAK